MNQSNNYSINENTFELEKRILCETVFILNFNKFETRFEKVYEKTLINLKNEFNESLNKNIKQNLIFDKIKRLIDKYMLCSNNLINWAICKRTNIKIYKNPQLFLKYRDIFLENDKEIIKINRYKHVIDHLIKENCNPLFVWKNLFQYFDDINILITLIHYPYLVKEMIMEYIKNNNILNFGILLSYMIPLTKEEIEYIDPLVFSNTTSYSIIKLYISKIEKNDILDTKNCIKNIISNKFLTNENKLSIISLIVE